MRIGTSMLPLPCVENPAPAPPSLTTFSDEVTSGGPPPEPLPPDPVEFFALGQPVRKSRDNERPQNSAALGTVPEIVFKPALAAERINAIFFCRPLKRALLFIRLPVPRAPLAALASPWTKICRRYAALLNVAPKLMLSKRSHSSPSSFPSFPSDRLIPNFSKRYCRVRKVRPSSFAALVM